MSWEFGIPDELGPYTYFQALNSTEPDLVGQAKRALYKQAMGVMNQGLAELNSEQKLQAADTFMASIAISERGKELAAIQSYCKETSAQFPALEKFLNNPQSIYNNPDQFYLQLTKAINIIRLGTEDYKRELTRIKRNLDSLKGDGTNSRTIYSYISDDYRYKLVEDLTSFMAHITGNEQWIKEKLRQDYKEKDFTLKVENIAIRILKESNMINLISSGEDFAAIAANVLVDIERAIQEEVDKINPGSTLNNVSDQILERVEQRYLAQLKAEDNKKTPIQRALNDIHGTDFNRVVKNAKQLLGITIPDNRLKKLDNNNPIEINS